MTTGNDRLANKASAILASSASATSISERLSAAAMSVRRVASLEATSTRRTDVWLIEAELWFMVVSLHGEHTVFFDASVKADLCTGQEIAVCLVIALTPATRITL
jgi:hypothetical protein